MKKSLIPFILLTVIFLSVLVGIFIGRNTVNQLHLPADDTISTSQQADGKIDINTATHAQLTLLPGIGDELASRIINYRAQNGPYKNIADLLCVEGIGKTKFERIQDYIKVGG